MDFETAVVLSERVEREYPGLVVGGFRRMSKERPHDSWALDIVERATGRMVTLDEKDAWQRVLEVNFPELARAR
ncbi:MAG TPA: hypothetical protein VNN21_06805 [Dehalococcoidia bacterium]|nr:hypothetical protein [Dehalococcoidia bacterium]